MLVYIDTHAFLPIAFHCKKAGCAPYNIGWTDIHFVLLSSDYWLLTTAATWQIFTEENNTAVNFPKGSNRLGIESQSKKAEKVSRGKEMDWDQAGIGGFGRKFLRATALKPAQNAALSIKYYQSLI